MNGIWIRSQDKCRLVFSHRILMGGTRFKTEFQLLSYEGNSADSEDYDVLGVYPTEARALEVLDEIQTAIINSKKIYVGFGGDVQSVETTAVYQMPAE